MRKVGVNALEIFTLCALVFAQPVLQILQVYPQFLIARHFGLWGVTYVVILVWLLPPLVLLCIELPFLKWPKVHRVVHLAILFLLFLIFGDLLMGPLQVRFLGSTAPIIGAVVVAVGCTVLWARFKSARTFLQILSPAILIVPLLFFLSPSIRKILEAPPPPRQTPVPSSTNVVLVVLDEFSGNSLMNAEHNIDAARFPYTAELPKSFTWYRHASAPADGTTQAVPAIVTGYYPDVKKDATIRDYPDNLFTLLAPSYDLEVSETITGLYPEHRETEIEYRATALDMLAIYLQLVVPERYASAVPSIAGKWSNFWEGETRKHGKQDVDVQFNEFLSWIRPHPKPTLYFIHTLFPHSPWYLFPSGTRYDVQSTGAVGIPAMTANSLWGNDYWPIVLSLQRYLLTVGYFDHLMQKLIDQLRREKLYDSSLIIVTADHGIAFEPKDWRRAVTKTNFADIMSVPLFVKLPGQTTGSIDDRNVETIDILPTIADVLKTRPGWKVEGVSLLAPAPSRRTKKIYEGTGEGFLETEADIVGSSKMVAMESRLGLLGKPLKESLAIGPAPELLGKSLASLSPKPDPAFKVDLNFKERYLSVDPTAEVLPYLISGRIYCGLDKPFTIAVTVNGIVRTTTQTFLPYNVPGGFGYKMDPLKKGIFYFVALVPEGSFTKGKNDIQVLVAPKPGVLSLAVH